MPEIHWEKCGNMRTQATLLSRRGKPKQAIDLFEKCHLLEGQVWPPLHPDALTTMRQIGSQVSRLGEYKDALAILNDCQFKLELIKRTNNTDYSSCLSAIASIYDYIGKCQKSLTLYEQCLEIEERLLGKETSNYSATLCNQASVLDNMGRQDEALEKYEESRQIDLRTVGPLHPNYATTLSNMAVIYKGQRNFQEALKLLFECQHIQKETIGEIHSDYADTLNNIAVIYYSTGRTDEALSLYEKCAEIEHQTVGNTPGHATTLFNIGLVYMRRNQPEKSLEYFEKCRVIRERTLGRKTTDYQNVVNAIRRQYDSEITSNSTPAQIRLCLLKMFTTPLDDFDAEVQIPKTKFESLAFAHKLCNTPLPNELHYSVGFAQCLMECAESENDIKNELNFLAASILHRILAPSIQPTIFNTQFDWTFVCELRWYPFLYALRLSRILFSNQNKHFSDRQRTILNSIMRIVASDPTPQQKFLNKIIEIGSDKRTLGESSVSHFYWVDIAKLSDGEISKLYLKSVENVGLANYSNLISKQLKILKNCIPKLNIV